MTGIYLGLGSNIGNREQNLVGCIELLNNTGEIRVFQSSSVYESEPVGYKSQPNFLNMVVEIDTELSPLALLKRTQHIEKQIGRKKTFVWGPRVIDIDILNYVNLVLEHPNLVLPHQQLHLRRFVMIPLKEVAEGYFHPKLNKPIDELLNECQDQNQVRLIIPRNEFFKANV